jgi:hypothetical protein
MDELMEIFRGMRMDAIRRSSSLRRASTGLRTQPQFSIG